MSTRSTRHPEWHDHELRRHATTTDRDLGYTLIEMLIVVVILGVLTAAAVLAVSGMSTEAADTGCQADRRQLHVAVGAYQAQTGNDTITAVGTDHDRFEQVLVDGEFLRAPSEMHDLDADGHVTPQEGSGC